MPVPEDSITTLTEYFRLLDVHCREDGYLFRGQPEDLPLRPCLNRVSLDEPRDVVEKQMVAELKRTAVPHLPFNPKNDWEWLALAQHHGMATRLLDWTANPLAAAWFAVAEAPKSGPGVIWMFRPGADDYVDIEADPSPFGVSRTRIFQPSHISPRLVAQNGWFTVHKYLSDNDSFGAVENNSRYKGSLRRMMIPAEAFWRIRWDLDLCGINAASLFPGLDGLAKHVTWKYSRAADEKGTPAAARGPLGETQIQ